MPDIAMCKNENCKKKLKCYRYTATPSEYRQSYMNFTREDCSYFWDNSKYKNDGKNKGKD